MKQPLPPTSDPTEHLFTSLREHPSIGSLAQTISSIQPGEAVRYKGVTGSALAVIVAGLHIQETKQPLLIVANDEESAGYLYSDLTQILGRESVLFFPSSYRRHIRYGHTDAGSEVLRSELIARLSLGECPIIVSHPFALAEGIPNANEVETHVRSLRVGEEVDRQQLRAWFVDEGFTITDYVYQPGEVAFRGSIVDIFAYNAERPIRLDFFDTEIESIRSFDIDTQLSHEKLEEVTLSSNLANMAGGEKGQSLFSFLSQDYTLLFTDYEAALGRITQLYQEEAVLVEGEGFSSTEEMRAKLIALETLPQEIHCHRLILGMLPSGMEVTKTIEFATLPQPLFHKNFDLLIEGLKHYKEKGYRVWFLTESTPQAERLREILSDLGEASLMPEPLPLTLHEGFEDADSAMVFLTDHQIFERYHKYRLQSDRIRTGGVSLSLKELKSFTPGDFIVHYDHGIGRFAGLFTQRDGDKQQEVVKIDYRDGAYILVSVHNLRKLSKYRNRDDEPPKLSELGGGAWNRLKERTKKRVKDIARDLIRLYAARRESEGFAFSPDSYLQHELEASFIYEETPDQLKAMEAVKQDMEQPRPMDRLICGDVGFGKTEIAIRAAFKAVADSKQVAVLVPTTILAYQHYRTFSERLKDLPVRVAYFSRAQSAKESKQLLEDLKEGKIDIVVGTHRLVGKNVQFKDLGLLVIDEEQKFGVAVKEKLRSLQVNVDTLTMSATPIPRTLQFSLMGTRDLSNILTPPRNRYPVATEVIRFDPEAIAEAINFELSRNGQVFFVHNRIDDIEGIARMIQQRIPDCRIAVGHGRMNQTELEQLFVSFSQHEFDVLVSTTIVENGIDVSNANTIIIDSAHHFGLSDLHQLRGRVGRSSRKAFCYLITPPMDLLPEASQRRLRAIESYSDLGSGIRIAMQDLDIRGAGNVFGSEQSGFIADLGFDAYHKVFDEAVREVKREEFEELFQDESAELAAEEDCPFESDLYLSLPPDYVPQDSERISLYRELDNLTTEEEVKEFRERLEDRFGRLPSQVEQLILVPILRRWGRSLGVQRIVLKAGVLYFFLPEDPDSPYYQGPLFGQLIAYASFHHRQCRLEESKKGLRMVRFSGIGSVGEIITLIRTILGEKA